MQVRNLEKFLAWLKSSPCQFTVSSMSGGYVHVKFLVPCDEEIARTHCLNSMSDMMQPAKYRPQVRDDESVAMSDALMNKCYDEGFKDGRHIAEEDSDADNS